ncbi:transporter substrate-binding domain-containing protein [Thermosediminibacter litoriperuensis]|uniref:histidine kinase n=1 Tax=Thermosediminibacter litoriperuensis TaxID=291989 RepID=A0A5S5AQ66_9FIRM|nr:transporter substrate-binding domain-containing protein [Thermosediminibacter litoriperuensis]TYP53789.1 polar amino acid transport system substrate-binding protein [Thermosediminibacter litoriperuensis]
MSFFRSKAFFYLPLSLILILIAFFIIQIIKISTGDVRLTEEERNYLLKKGKIVYGAHINAPPLRYVDESDGQYKGLVIDYLHALSIELGVNIETRPYLWTEALGRLESGRTDICDMFESSERSKKYLFTKPIYNLRGVVAVRSNNKEILKPADLDKRVVALEKGDYTNEFFAGNFPGARILYVDDIKQAMDLLSAGRVDAVAGDEPVVLYFINKMGLEGVVDVLDHPLYEKPVVFGVSRSEADLVPILNKGIDRINGKNVLEKIQQKWFGLSTSIIVRKDTSNINRYLMPISVILVLVMAFFAVINHSLKKEVYLRTRDLEISKNHLQTIFDGIEQMIAVVSEDLSIIDANKNFQQFTAKPLDVLKNMKMCDAAGVFCRKDCSCCIFRKCIDEPLKNCEFKAGDKIYSISTYNLRNQSLSSKKVLVIIDDITIRRFNEIQVLQANKMMAVGQLAAGVAHEIRNPLGIIRTYNYILRNRLPEGDGVAAKSIFEINRAVDRADRIINNLLNFSRIPGERWEWVDLNDFIRDTLELQESYIKKYKISSKIEDKTAFLYYTSVDGMHHIVMNIIANAIDAMKHKGGSLTVEIEDKADGFSVTFADTGEGIKKEHMDHIFNPFFTTKQPGKGTGLGLFITYTEIKKLNGEIFVKSEEGIGTEIRVRIPAKRRSKNEERI